MDIASWVLIGLLVLAFLLAIGIYNGLVTLKHSVAKHFSNIDVLLRQRHDELPKLVESCKRYMTHERETLQAVTDARSQVSQARQQGDVSRLGMAETALRAGLGQLFAVVENYPELKADSSFQHLQHRISELERSIADRREIYNESVNLLNVRIEQFPDVILARFFGFKPATLLEFRQEQLRDPDLKQLFDG